MAKVTECLNNQRQLYLAMAMYAEENDEIVPVGHGGGGRTQNNYYISVETGWFLWGYLQMNESVSSPFSWYCPLQTSDLLSYNTARNPWPPMQPPLETRSSYSLRPVAEWVGAPPVLSSEDDRGKLVLSELAESAIFADSVSRWEFVEKSHTISVNSTYGDGALKTVSIAPVKANLIVLPEYYDINPTTTTRWNHLAVWSHMDDER